MLIFEIFMFFLRLPSFWTPRLAGHPGVGAGGRTRGPGGMWVDFRTKTLKKNKIRGCSNRKVLGNIRSNFMLAQEPSAGHRDASGAPRSLPGANSINLIPTMS